MIATISSAFFSSTPSNQIPATAQAMENLPVDYFTNSSAYTPHVHRDVYPAIDPAAPQNSQAGKVVIITGASAGIGARGFTPAFARANAKALVLVARSQDKLDATAAEVKKINPKVEVITSVAHINSEADVTKFYETVKEKFGHADVLINNAGKHRTLISISNIY